MTGEAPDPAKDPAKTTAGVLGLGAVVCVACCAGPIVAVLSAIGIASVAGYLLAGSAALAVGVVAAAMVIVRRRRRAKACVAPVPTTTVLATPTIKPAAAPAPTTSVLATPAIKPATAPHSTGVERSAAGQTP